MSFRLLFGVLSVTLFISCDFISPGNPTHQNLPIQNTKIDYSLVDVYPLFRECNGCDAAVKQNLCFESVLVNSLEKTLKKNEINVNTQIPDTVFVDLLVDRKSKITIIHINASQEILQVMPDLDSILKSGISQLPEIIQPALKRGIPVDVQFRLPVKIRQVFN